MGLITRGKYFGVYRKTLRQSSFYRELDERSRAWKPIAASVSRSGVSYTLRHQASYGERFDAEFAVDALA
jgi:hypothetical protein